MKCYFQILDNGDNDSQWFEGTMYSVNTTRGFIIQLKTHEDSENKLKLEVFDPEIQFWTKNIYISGYMPTKKNTYELCSIDVRLTKPRFKKDKNAD